MHSSDGDQEKDRGEPIKVLDASRMQGIISPINYATAVIAYARDHKSPVQGSFYGFEFICAADDAAADLAARIDTAMQEAKEEREGSVKGKEAATQAVRYQTRWNALVGRVDSLDFEDIEAVLDWLSGAAEVSDDREVIKTIDERERILAVFKAHGYSGDDDHIFPGADREAIARNIIMNSIKALSSTGGFNPHVIARIKEWKELLI